MSLFIDWLKRNKTKQRNHPFFFMLSMFALILFFPVFTESSLAKMAFCSLFTVVVLSSVLSIMRNRVFIFMVAILGIPWLILSWVDCIRNIEHPASDIIEAIMLIIFCGLLFAMMAYKIVVESHDVTKHTIYNAISAYLLLGLFFANLYSLLSLCGVQVFSISPNLNLKDLHDVWATSAYYSYCSLTTLGMGDITPASPVSRSLTTMEAVVGPLYLSILIARLVSTYKNSHKKQD